MGFVTNVTWQDNQNLDRGGGPGGGLCPRDQGIDRHSERKLVNGHVRGDAERSSSLPITAVLRPRDPSRNAIYAATHVGIYGTTDGGASWRRSNRLPTVQVNDIYIPPDGAHPPRDVWP
jgi:hypothetical protein